MERPNRKRTFLKSEKLSDDVEKLDPMNDSIQSRSEEMSNHKLTMMEAMVAAQKA